MNNTILYLLTLITLTAMLPAKIIDGIALVVEGEVVTTAEIRAIRTNLGISKAKATDLLIQDRLQKVAMKDINIPEVNIDQKIGEIAAQNAISIPKMQKILKQQGTPWVKYRQSIREALKKEKFYQEKVIASIPAPSQDELKLFYTKHQKAFTIPKNIHLTEYSADTEEKMKQFLRTHKKSNVKSRKVTKSVKTMEPTLLNMFLQIPKGKYTAIINAGDQYIVYKVRSIQGKTFMPFEAAQGAVAAKWKQEQQSKALKDYFEKMKTRADVQILR